MGDFLKELRRRKVFQVAAIYAVTAWLLAQGAALAESSLALPAWFDAAIIVTLALGFPIAIILAYAFEVTPDGLRRTGASEDEADDRRQRGIAVLPFLNMSDDREQEFLADGMTEDLITKLAFQLDMMVIARNSSFHYKGTSPDVREVGRELGVLYVLEGSIRRMGENTRITAQLIETENGSHIWSENYDRPTSEIFNVQDEVVEAIAAALNSSLRISEAVHARQKPAEDLEVWELLARSNVSQGKVTAETLREGESWVDQALQKDPGNIRGMVIKGVMMSTRYANFDDTMEAAAFKAETLDLLKGVRSKIGGDPNLIAMLGMGLVQLGEHAETIALLDVDDPALRQFTMYYMALGYALGLTGEAERAVTLMEEARRRDPVGFTGGWWQWLGQSYASAGRFEDAIAAVRESIRQQPDYVWSWIQLSIWLIREGDTSGAARAIMGARNVEPDLTPEALSQKYDNLGIPEPIKGGLVRRFRQAFEAAGLD